MHPRSALLLALFASCTGAAPSPLAEAITDTLPGGIPRVGSAGPTAWTDSAGARLVEEIRFSGEDGTASEIGQPRSVAVDEAGRIYVVDSKPAIIKVFAPDGRLIRTMGGEGEGPGEFRAGFIAARGGHLVIHDPQLARTTVWDTSGALLRSWHSSCCYWSDIQIDRAQRIYVPSMVALKAGETPRGAPYVRWSLEGAAQDTIWVPYREPEKVWTVSVKGPDGKMMSSMSTGIPLMPALVSTLHPDGGMVYGWSAGYSLVRSGTGRDTARIFGRAWTPEAVDDARRRSEVEAMVKSAGSFGEENVRAAFRLEDIPATLPAFRSLRVDRRGRVWVRRHSVTDTMGVSFEVFDSSGAYLGPVGVPLSINEWGLQAWTEQGLVAIVEDQDGRPVVVRLRFEIAPRRE